MNLELSRRIFKKNFQISNFMKIRPVGAEMFHGDGRTHRPTEMTNLIIAFSKFCEIS